MSQSYAIDTVEGSQWDGLVSHCEFTTVYHRDGWLGIIEECEGVSIQRVVCYKNEMLQAVWPIGIFRKGPLRVGGSPLPGWNTAYLGPVFTSECDDKPSAVKAMLNSKLISNPSFVALRCMDIGVDLSECGFEKTREFRTYGIDLTRDKDELFSALKGTCRTRVRKGTKNGLEIRFEEGDEYLDDYWKMANDVFSKSNLKPPFTENFLRVMHKRLFSKGELLVPTAYFGDERVATLIVPHDGKTGMYFAGGTFGEKLKLAPNNLLHWETMMECKRLGMERYDFISINGKPGKFKRTFNPEERVGCIHWERTNSQLVKWLRDKYEVRARARRKYQ